MVEQIEEIVKEEEKNYKLRMMNYE